MPDYPNDILVQYPISSFEYPPPKSHYRMAPTCLWYHFKKEDLPFITHTHVIRSDGSIKDYSRINPTEDMQWLNIDNAYCSNIGPHIGAVYLDPDNKKQLVLLIKRSFPIKEKTTRKETMFIWWNIPLRIIGKENLFEGWIEIIFNYHHQLRFKLQWKWSSLTWLNANLPIYQNHRNPNDKILWTTQQQP